MKRLIGWVVFAVAGAAWPIAAPAQVGSGIWGSGIHGNVAHGEVRGHISSIDHANGIIRLKAGGGTVVVHAKPTQLVDLTPGVRVNIEYNTYGGVRWMTGASSDEGGFIGGGSGLYGYGYGGGSYGGGGSWSDPEFGDFGYGGNRRFGERVRTSGEVVSVDNSRGTVKIQTGEGTTTVYGHPEELRELLPGQFVSISYARVGSRNWIAGIDYDNYGGVGFGGRYGGNF